MKRKKHGTRNKFRHLFLIFEKILVEFFSSKDEESSSGFLKKIKIVIEIVIKIILIVKMIGKN